MCLTQIKVGGFRILALQDCVIITFDHGINREYEKGIEAKRQGTATMHHR